MQLSPIQVMNHLSSEAIQRQLKTRAIGQSPVVFERIGSTNTELKRLAVAGAPEGMLATAEEQTAGRGRFERRWLAPAGTSLLTSLLFRPAFLHPNRAQYLTMICALATVDAITEVTGISADLKWPNDVVYQHHKLAGLLTELSLNGSQLDWVVVGMGLNVNVDFRKNDAALALTQNAVSLQMITGKAIDRVPLLQAYLFAVEKRYDALKQGATPFNAWATALVTIGQSVTVSGAGETLQGTAEGVGESGALLLRLSDGRLESIVAGDVSLDNSSP